MVRRPAARTAAAIAAAAGLALLASACGGSPASRLAQLGTTAAQRGTSSAMAAHQNGAIAYSRCMRSHGVPNFPHPTKGGAIPKVSLQQVVGVGNSELQAAQKACNALWPTVSATQQQQVRAQALMFSRCMRNQGINDFPDPDTNGGIRIPDSIESSPGLQAAINACKPLPPPPNLGPPGGDG